MLQLLLTIADNGDASPWGVLVVVAIGIIVTILQAFAKSRRGSDQQQRQGQPGSKPAGGHPVTVDEFLEKIRRIAQGEQPDAGSTAPGPQQPVSRPTPPTVRPAPRTAPPAPQTARPVPPPPPPRPAMPRPAVPQIPTAPRIERPPVVPRPVEMPARPAAPSRMETPSPEAPLASAPPRRAQKGLALEPASDLLVRAERPKEPAAAPVRTRAAVGPAELRAALRRRLAAGPSALREAVLLGEVLGQPISMRRLRMRRPGSVGRLI